MKTTETYISKLNNGDLFYIGIKEYRFVGKSIFQTEETDEESYVACDQDYGNLVSFSALQSVRVPRPKPVRTDFWYKKKFLELVVQRSISYDRVESKFSKISHHLFAIINKDGRGTIDMNDYGRDDYIITVNFKWRENITIMLINTINGKSVAVKHIDRKKVTTDNVQLILFELYKKYMNQ